MLPMAPGSADEVAAGGLPDGTVDGPPTPHTTSSSTGGASGSDASGAAKASPSGGDGASSDDGAAALKPVSLVGLYRFASRGDLALLAVGVVCAIGHGTMLP